jgi:predicted AAA+ superfamily ATPase
MLIPPEEILRSVRTENPWWETGVAAGRFADLPERAYLDAFTHLVTDWRVNRAVVLMGPRRVGKTVMVQQLIGRLIKSGADPRSILYVSIDTPTYTGLALDFFVNQHAVEMSLGKDEKRYIIFDEIQYLSDWERHLKVLVDRNPNIRFVASGSAAAALKRASSESGAGRFTDFILPPLTFAEYIEFVGKNTLISGLEPIPGRDQGMFHVTNDIEGLNDEFCNYINFGGYPEAVFSEAIRSDAARYIKNDIIDKVLLRDLPQLYGITNIQELNNLFTSLAYLTGQETSLEKLSQNSGISKPTIAKYMEYLEAAFLIFRVRRVDQNARRFTRERAFKVYLTNPSMRSALFSPLNSDADGFGHLVETAVMSQWQHSTTTEDLHYARWKRSGKGKLTRGEDAEIDIVSLAADGEPFWAVEIKWSDRAHTDSRSWYALEDYVSEHPKLIGTFTTKSVSASKRVDGQTFAIIPTALYCYTVGSNTQGSRGRAYMHSG